MSAEANAKLVRDMFAGDVDFMECLADDAVWVVGGTTKLSGTYSGKASIAADLIGSLMSQLTEPGSTQINNVIASGDQVVVEGEGVGRVTNTGKSYNNTYCFVFKFNDGKVASVHEYCDTELITEAFGK